LLLVVSWSRAVMAQSTADTAARTLPARGVPVIAWEPFVLETRAHGPVQAELGTLFVPEQYARLSGRPRALRFVRLKSVAQPATAAPVIYLAGGPGGSGIETARGPRWPIFDAVRQHADVILLDQRGSGRSDPPPPCPPPADAPLALDVPLQEAGPLLRAVEADATRCIAFWRANGVALESYTTEASADDIALLRRALAVPRVSLWGMSYGTHLALAVLRRHGATVERAALMGTEGPDHTLKLPLSADSVLARVDAWAASDPAASTMTPDLIGTIDRQLARLATTPAVAEVPGADGRPTRVAIGRFDLQLAVAMALGRTNTASLLPPALGLLEAGDASLLARLLVPIRRGVFQRAAMPLAMDAASGATIARRRTVAEQAKASRLGDALNFPMLDDTLRALGLRDLGDRFRAPVRSRVPTLFVSGTLDARTPPANADEVLRQFGDARHLVLVGAGHDDDLWTSTPIVRERIAAFFRGETVEGGRVDTPLLRVPTAPPGR
jgi:pimeloyl-ACP methyl ester carboxylesterase